VEHWDVLIVGAGPAGSSCAWALRDSGLRVLLVDRAVFPRDKVCGGWITPQVVSALRIDIDEYATQRTLQPFTGFHIGYGEQPAVKIDYKESVSYGIRRCELDEFLARRCGARLREDFIVRSVERDGPRWIVNDQLSADLLIGAGGNFCPLAQKFGSRPAHRLIVAQEAEFRMSPTQRAACAVSADAPELYFCEDLDGYGWCVRKGDYLNIGLGRTDKHGLSAHVREFLCLIRRIGRIGFELEEHLLGHAYQIYARKSASNLPAANLPDRLLLIGDSLGVAAAASGEGIGPAVITGLLAAESIRAAKGDYRAHVLASYADAVERTFNSGFEYSHLIPAPLRPKIAARLLRTEWFCRHVVLDRWFLQANRSVPGPKSISYEQHAAA